MDQNYTDVTLLLDRTGSMKIIASDVIGGVNQLIQDQRKTPGKCTLTLIQFDSQNPHEVVYAGKPIVEAPFLTSETYVPRASTPLLDAIGYTVERTGLRLKKMPEAERPGRVLIVVQTDGLENASHRFTLDQVNTMIEHQKSVYKWVFLFLGADLSTLGVGQDIGVGATHSLRYSGASGQSVSAAYKSVSGFTSAYRSSDHDAAVAVASCGFAPEDRQAQEALVQDDRPKQTTTDKK